MNQKKTKINNWLKFSQMGLQMAITIALCVFLGNKLDASYPKIAPFGIVSLSLFGVFTALYTVIKQVLQMKNED